MKMGVAIAAVAMMSSNDSGLFLIIFIFDMEFIHDMLFFCSSQLFCSVLVRLVS